jgi:LAO/AO transport system kinase
MAEAAKSTQDSLAERVIAGDKRALARAISLVENRDAEGDRLVAELFPRTGRARIVGVTGPPGVGKSTLIGALTAELRKADRDVGVLSIDPSSPFTQGAMLGDRIRLADHFLDPGVFIRSMATRGSLGGLAEAALQAALLMDASGKDDVLLETVGVGQGEVDVVDHADTIVLALMPGSGDSIQALKAGVMEIPDVIVVNKSEHPLADTMVREVRTVLSLGPQSTWKVPVVRTEAAKGQGIAELLERIDAHRRHIEDTGSLAERRARNLRAEVLGLAAVRLRRQLEERAESDPRGTSRERSGMGGAARECRAASDGPRHCGAEAARQGQRRLTRLAHRAPVAQSNGTVAPFETAPPAGPTITRVRRPSAPRSTRTSDHCAHGAKASASSRARREGSRLRSFVFLSMGPPTEGSSNGCDSTTAAGRNRAVRDNQVPVWAVQRPRRDQRIPAM